MRMLVTIDFTGTAATQVTFGEYTPSLANVSDISKVFKEGSTGYRGFQLSATRQEPVTTLNDTYKLFGSQGYVGFLTTVRSNLLRQFSPAVPVTFYLAGTVPQSLFIVFDMINKEYAEWFEISNSVNGNVYRCLNNNTPIVEVPMSTMGLTDTQVSNGVLMTLSIKRWSKKWASAKVTRITPYYTAEFTGKDIIDVACSENLLDSQMQVRPGICEQYADVRVYDRYGILHSLAQRGLLVEDHKMTIQAVDTVNGVLHTLGTYVVSGWDIAGNDSKLLISGRDISYTFENIHIESIPIKDRTVAEMLTLLFAHTGGTAWRYINYATQVYCECIITPNNWFYAGTLSELLNKICTVGMLRIFWSSDAFVIARAW